MRPSHLVVKSLTHGSWSGNIVNRKPPQGGGFLSINFSGTGLEIPRGCSGHEGVSKDVFRELWVTEVCPVIFLVSCFAHTSLSESSRRRSKLLNAVQTSILQELTKLARELDNHPHRIGNVSEVSLGFAMGRHYCKMVSTVACWFAPLSSFPHGLRVISGGAVLVCFFEYHTRSFFVLSKCSLLNVTKRLLLMRVTNLSAAPHMFCRPFRGLVSPLMPLPFHPLPPGENQAHRLCSKNDLLQAYKLSCVMKRIHLLDFDTHARCVLRRHPLSSVDLSSAHMKPHIDWTHLLEDRLIRQLMKCSSDAHCSQSCFHTLDFFPERRVCFQTWSQGASRVLWRYQQPQPTLPRTIPFFELFCRFSQCEHFFSVEPSAWPKYARKDTHTHKHTQKFVHAYTGTHINTHTHTHTHTRKHTHTHADTLTRTYT